jgi:NAD(P)-dependent dehydrogenase (short-subunit alcohol dehydrogenase family)
MTVIAAKDLAPFDIRVNSISPAYIGPGFMWTRQVELQAKAGSVYFSEDPEKVAYQMVDSVPMRRYGSINEVIGPVLFLLSDDASYLTGIDIKITGGE